jgi:hypothetical protein
LTITPEARVGNDLTLDIFKDRTYNNKPESLRVEQKVNMRSSYRKLPKIKLQEVEDDFEGKKSRKITTKKAAVAKISE